MANTTSHNRRAAISVAGRVSIRGMITMLENGQPLTDEIRFAICQLVWAAAKASRRPDSSAKGLQLCGSGRVNK